MYMRKYPHYMLLFIVSLLMMGNVTSHDTTSQLNDSVIIDTVKAVPQSTITVDISNDVEISKNIDYNYYLEILAKKLDVEYIDLFSIMAFETGGTFDPKIINRSSGNIGLLQFGAGTARTLVSCTGRKLTGTIDLVNEYPTVKDQLAIPNEFNPYGGPVYQYLMQNHPYKTKKQLYLTVFYPPALNWDDDRMLPDHVRKANPGLNRVGDYPKIIKSRLKFDTVNFIYD